MSTYFNPSISMMDDACDHYQIGKGFLLDWLPPTLPVPEQYLTKGGTSDGSNNNVIHHHHHDASGKIWPNTLFRRVYHGTLLSSTEFEVDDAPALEQLLTTVDPR